MGVSDFIKRAAGRTSVGLHQLGWFGARDSIGILLYHRISPHVEGLREPDFNVTPERFRRQLEGLLRAGFTFCKLQDAIDRRAEGKAVDPKTAIVTFDDGFENVYTHAWPVMRELEIPSTIFLNTAFLDSDEPFPFDRWGIEYQGQVPLEAYRPLTHKQCHEMQASGLVELGAHTHTHQDFRNRVPEFADDLRTNLTSLRETFAIDRPTFAFPFGRVALGFAGGELTEAARQAGVRCALTTECDANLPHSDSFSWGRCNVYEWDTPRTIEAKLAGWYAWAPKLQERLSSRGV